MKGGSQGIVNRLWTAVLAPLRAAAPDSLRLLPMWGTTTLRLPLPQYANCGGRVGSANRTR